MIPHNDVELAEIQSRPMEWTHRASFFVIAVTLFTMIAAVALFGELSVSVGFLFWNLLTVVLFFFCLHLLRNFIFISSERRFQYSVLSISIGIRLFVMMILYMIFYNITGTSFDVEAIDALNYHDLGFEVARQLGDGKLDFYGLSSGGLDQFDDLGYGIFLGFIYYLFDNSIIMARVIQCVLDGISVILIYKISKIVWEEDIARIAAMLSMLFPMQILYSTLHLKETLMVFCLLTGVLAVYRLSERIRIGYLSLLVCSAIVLASTRTALLIVFIAAIFLFFTFRRATNLFQKTFLIVLVFSSIILSMIYLGVEQEPLRKTLRLIGSEEDVRLGGQSLQLLASRGQSLADQTSMFLLGIQSFLTPYPSMVRTNIVYFNQTMQWYQIGALFVWGYLVFFGIYGLYHSIRFHFNESLFLSALVIGYTVALVISVYVMSIRYNIIKLVLFLPFIAVGMAKFPQTRLRIYYIYCIFFAFIVLGWNFVKLYGKGYI